MRVLVVDENPDTRESLIEAVEVSPNCHAEGAGKESEAVELFRENRHHLVFLDYDRGQLLDGPGLLRELHELDREAILVAILEDNEEDLAIEALKQGASNYVQRPLNPKLLQVLLDRYDSRIDSLERKARILDLITSNQTCLRVPTDPSYVSAVVEYILDEIRDSYPRVDISGIHLGLEEILRNAMEHGNLEIGFESKASALVEFEFADLVKARLCDPRYRHRCVKVDYCIENGTFTCSVEDEGPGFNYREQWDPLSPEGLARLNGRGIFLTRTFFDSVTYEGRGNRVVLVKRLDSVPSKSEHAPVA